MSKLQRNYVLTVATSTGQTVTIKPPFTLELDITRNILATANTASFRVYNLTENVRNLIYKDKFSFEDYRSVELKAGYGNQISTIFKGNVLHCWSNRENTNFISTLECFDAGFAYQNSKIEDSISKGQFPAGTAVESIFDDMIGTLGPSVTKGAFGDLKKMFPNLQDGKTGKGNTYSGNTRNIVAELTRAGQFFVDNEKAYILSKDECIAGSITKIDSKHGLLGSPIREETLVNFEMLFEPGLLIGQKIQVESSTFPFVNGPRKVMSVRHRGMISDAVSGTLVTSGSFLFGPDFVVVN